MQAINLKTIYNHLRNDKINILCLNYLLIAYLLSLLFSYKLDNYFMGIIILVFLFNENLKQRLLFALSHKVVQACFLFFSVVVLWSIASDDISLALYHIKSYRHFLYSIIFVAIIRKDFINKLLYIFIISMMLQVIYFSLMHFNLLDSPFKVDPYFPFLFKFEHAFLVLIALGFSLYKIITLKKYSKIKLILGVFFILETFNIFSSGSRTGILLYSIILLITLSYIFKKNLIKALTFTIFLAALALSFALLFTPMKEDLKRAEHSITQALSNQNYNSSSGLRIGLSIYAYDIFIENPLFGIGTSNHIETLRKTIHKVIEKNPEKNSQNQFKYMLDVLNTGKLATIHNTYLELLMQFGIIGFIFLLNIFYQTLRSRNFSESSHYFFALLLSIIVLITMFPGLTFQHLNSPKFFILMISILTAKKYFTTQKLT